MKTYICHPLTADSMFEVLLNIWNALRWGSRAMRDGHRPVVTHIYAIPGILNPYSQEDDELARCFGLAELRDCAQVWVCGPRVSPGMLREIELAERLGIVIVVKKED